jgi:hypothetical protein
VNAQLLATCPSCHGSYHVAGQVVERSTAIPKSLTMTRDADALVFIRRWRTPHYYYLAIWCILWIGLTIVLGIGFRGKAITDHQAWITLLLWLLMGLVTAYSTLAGFLNRTIIRVTPLLLTVRHGPLPWPWQRTVSVSGIDQLYCVVLSMGEGNTFYLRARTRDGARFTLVSHVWQLDEVLYIEHQVEDYLEIVDRPVEVDNGWI